MPAKKDRPSYSKLQRDYADILDSMMRLTKENSELKRALDQQDIVTMSDYTVQVNANKKLQEYNSKLTEQLTKEIKKNSDLTATIQDLKHQIETLNAATAFSNIHNARGAGRKRHFVNEQEIIKCRAESMSIKAIAEKFNISTSTVNRILNPELRK